MSDRGVRVRLKLLCKGVRLSLFIVTLTTLGIGQESATKFDAKTSLLNAFKNARASKKVRLTVNSMVNDVMEEAAVIEFVSPNRYYQKISKRKTDQTLYSERIQIGRQTFEKIGDKWRIERGLRVSVKDSFESALASVLVNSEAAWPKLISLKVDRVGTETVNCKSADLFSYDLENNWLPYLGKVWIIDGLPVKAEMWTPKGSLNKIFSSTVYDYEVEVKIENPIAAKPRGVGKKGTVYK